MLISEISFGILYKFKRYNVLQMFFFNLVENKVRLFTNKQEVLTILHLRSFRQFQNLSEETWSRAAENLIELCFVAFLSNKSKKCFILVWIIFFVFRNYRDIDFALCCMDVLATNAQISMNWNLMLNFVNLKQRIFKRHSTSYWPNVGVGFLEKFSIFNFLASAWDSKGRFDQSD